MDLPALLADSPFTPAQAALEGVSRKRLEHRALARPTYGARSDRPVATLLDQVIGTLVALPPDVVVSHQSAARVWDLPLPTPWSSADPLDIMRTSAHTPLRRRGVRAHRGLERRRVVRHVGVPVVTAADTWCDLSGLVSVDDLVVIRDHLLHCERGLNPEDLDAAIRRRLLWRGASSLPAARMLIRGRSASPMETRARLLFARGGLPEPELNAEIRHGVEGQWLATPDFVWRSRRVAAEYDGDHHRTNARQWRNDIGRRENLADDGWRLVILTAADIFVQPDVAVSRLRRLLLP